MDGYECSEAIDEYCNAIKMKILHVITGMQKAAGTTTFVKNVVEGLRLLGHDAEIVMSGDGFRMCDVMHIHGLWSGLLHDAAVFAQRNSVPVVWSTHGMTAPWSMRHKWWKKLPAWFIYQKRDLKHAHAIHCTTELEVKWNRALGLEPCFVAPLGTNIAKELPHRGEHVDRRLLYVGRIYPVKGLVNLIKAWSMVSADRWKLRMVGPDQAGHQVELERLVLELGLMNRVEFVGPKFGMDLMAEYAGCECLILPSFTENFGATIVDALASGKPCIASTFTPWEELLKCSCGWWVSNEPELLAKTIQEMIDIGDVVRREMGIRGRKLVDEKYTWNAVVERLIREYRNVL